MYHSWADARADQARSELAEERRERAEAEGWLPPVVTLTEATAEAAKYRQRVAELAARIDAEENPHVAQSLEECLDAEVERHNCYAALHGLPRMERPRTQQRMTRDISQWRRFDEYRTARSAAREEAG